MSAELPTSTTTPEETVEVFEQVARGLTLTKALYGLLLFLGCMAVMKVILSLIDRTMTRQKVEPTVHKFTHSSLKALMWVITGLIVAA